MAEIPTPSMYELIRRGDLQGLKDFVSSQRDSGADMTSLLNNYLPPPGYGIPLIMAIMSSFENINGLIRHQEYVFPAPDPLIIVKFLLDQPELNINNHQSGCFITCCYRGQFGVAELLMNRDELAFPEDAFPPGVWGTDPPNTPLGRAIDGLNTTLEHADDYEYTVFNSLRTPKQYYKLIELLIKDKRMVVPSIREQKRYHTTDPVAMKMIKEYFNPESDVCELGSLCTISGGKKKQ